VVERFAKDMWKDEKRTIGSMTIGFRE